MKKTNNNVPEDCNACGWSKTCDSVYGGLGCQFAEPTEPVEVPDVVNEPPHYRNGKFEVIDEMLIVFGPQKTFDFCILNAWKYRARAPFKGNMEQDMDKANRYMEMAKQIADAYKDEGYALQMPPVHLIKGE